MGALQWLQFHWLDFLQSVGIIVGLLFTATSIRMNSKVQRLANLVNFTKHHREIWTEFYDKPELARILKEEVDLAEKPVTRDEELFVTFLVLHLSGYQEALKQRLLVSPEGLGKDIRNFFSLPIPRAIWAKLRPLQDRDFVEFVESVF